MSVVDTCRGRSVHFTICAWKLAFGTCGRTWPSGSTGLQPGRRSSSRTAESRRRSSAPPSRPGIAWSGRGASRRRRGNPKPLPPPMKWDDDGPDAQRLPGVESRRIPWPGPGPEPGTEDDEGVIAYIDSSALVKLLRRRARLGRGARALGQRGRRRDESRLARGAGLRARGRGAQRAVDDVENASTRTSSTDGFLQEKTSLVEADDDVVNSAAILGVRHGLRGVDAIHVASA